MLFDEDDKYFGGTPKSRFMEIMFTANKNLVEDELSKLLQRYAAMELLLERDSDKYGDLDKVIKGELIANRDDIEAREVDLYLELAGNIVTRNE